MAAKKKKSSTKNVVLPDSHMMLVVEKLACNIDRLSLEVSSLRVVTVGLQAQIDKMFQAALPGGNKSGAMCGSCLHFGKDKHGTVCEKSASVKKRISVLHTNWCPGWTVHEESKVGMKQSIAIVIASAKETIRNSLR